MSETVPVVVCIVPPTAGFVATHADNVWKLLQATNFIINELKHVDAKEQPR